jgi:hypothetical protein
LQPADHGHDSDEYESGQKPGKQKLLRRGRRIQNAE